MKVIVLTLLLGLIASSSALGSSKRFGRQISIHSLHLEKISSFGSAIKGLIQLADAHELDPVIDILQETYDGFATGLNQFQTSLAVLTETAQQNAESAIIDINNIQSALEDAQDALQALQENQADVQAAIESNGVAINNAIDGRAQEVQRRQDVQTANQNHISNINDALKAVQDAEEILQNARDEDLPAGSSFIQTHSKRLLKSLVLVQKKLSNTKLKLSMTNLYINELVQMVQDVDSQGNVNNELFEQIFVLILNFKQSLTQEAQETQDADDQDAAASAANVQAFEDIIDAQRADLASNQEQSENLDAQITATENNIAALEQNLESAQENLNFIRSSFLEQSAVLEGIIARLEKDLDALQRALVYIRSEAADIDQAGVELDLDDAPAADVDADESSDSSDNQQQDAQPVGDNSANPQDEDWQDADWDAPEPAAEPQSQPETLNDNVANLADDDQPTAAEPVAAEPVPEPEPESLNDNVANPVVYDDDPEPVPDVPENVGSDPATWAPQAESEQETAQEDDSDSEVDGGPGTGTPDWLNDDQSDDSNDSNDSNDQSDVANDSDNSDNSDN